MRLNIRVIAIGAAALAAVLGSPRADAQTTNIGSFYVGANAGVLIPESISAHATGSAGGETVTISGDFNFDTGPAAGAFIGYHINEYIAIEGDFQYGGIEFSSFNGTGTATGPVTGSAAINLGVNGHVDTYTGLANAIVTPFARPGWNGFAPYVGGGVGFSAWNANINSISEGGATANLGLSHSETDLAIDAILGFDYAVTPQISVGGRYQFLWVNLSNLVSGGGITGSNSAFTGHMLTANAAWHF